MSDDNSKNDKSHNHDHNHNSSRPMKNTINYVFKEPTASTVKTFNSVEDFTHSFHQLLDLLERETHHLKEAVRLSQILIDNAAKNESTTDEEREALAVFHQGYVDLLNVVRHRCHWTFFETMERRDDTGSNKQEETK